MKVKKLIKNLIISIVLIGVLSFNISAQINPMAAQYFQNAYLANPSMAGIKQDVTINLGYREQWSNFDGSPKNISFTGEYGFDKVGIGANFYKDEAGLFSRSRLQVTFAYHLPLDYDEQKLHFGISLGLQTNSLNLQQVIGSQNDLIAMRFNEQKSILDSDFGLAYSNEYLKIEGSLSNLKNQLKIEDNEIVNYTTFFTAISYNVAISDWRLEPKLVYRGIKNLQSTFDIGFEIRAFENKLGFMSMYHKSQSTSLGLSFNWLKQWQLFMLYNTSLNSQRSYTPNAFEIGIQFNLKNKEFMF